MSHKCCNVRSGVTFEYFLKNTQSLTSEVVMLSSPLREVSRLYDMYQSQVLSNSEGVRE